MKEAAFYVVTGLSSLFVLGYSVHMFVGGLVSPATERWLIAAACLLGATVMAYMIWDVLRRRRGQKPR